MLLDSTEKTPIKSLLGETLVANIEEDLYIYLEQISVAPTVTRVLITSVYRKLKLWGDVKLEVNLAFSKSNLDVINKTKLRFVLFDQSEYEVTFPSL